MLEWIPGVGSVVARATWVDWTVLVGGLGALLYWLSTWTHDHFRRRGIPYARPLPLFGNMASIAFGLQSMHDFTIDLYKKFEGHKAFGAFDFMKPTLFIRDPELIRLVSIKEFDHFVDHLLIGAEKVEPWFEKNIFSLKGQHWRDMRATLSPAFTSRKMRNIFKLIDLCGVQMAEFLKTNFQTNKHEVYEAEMKEFFTRFANDVIATSAFGIEVDSLGQPQNEFYRMGRDLTKTSGIKCLIFLGYRFLPKVMEVLRIPFTSTKVRNFFHNLVHDTIRERQQKGIFRPDMLQLLMQAREGQLKAEAGDEQENISGAKLKKLTDLDMTAQAVAFLFAGFDTVSTAMSYCAYALARHPEVQQRLQREVDEAFEKNDGQLTYEAVQEAKYMDMFISEVMRLYPAIPSLDRVCTKDFTIPAQESVPAYTVRKCDVICIPVAALHKDSKYWSEPEVFDPERFSEENKQKIKPFTYIPFGIGPRICIEVLRLHSQAPSLDRVCTKDFTIPAYDNFPGYTVRKGESIRIPVSPLHVDPKYWDEPEKFDPERFNEENKNKITPFTYMPFGVGPRICMGKRFALLEVKVALSHILRHFSFQVTAKTPKKAEFAANDFSGRMKGGAWVGISPRIQ